MRYIYLVGLIGLAITFGLGVLIATSNDSLESFDPHRPATLLPIVASRLHALRSEVSKLRVREFVEATANALRESIQHENPTQSPSQ